jgi:acetylglutamate kinase
MKFSALLCITVSCLAVLQGVEAFVIGNRVQTFSRPSLLQPPTLSPSHYATAVTCLSALPTDFIGSAATIAAAAQSLQGKTIVVKYGGNAMTSEELKTLFCQDVATLQRLGVRVVVVHGGGPQINRMLDLVGVESRFEGGMRVSSKEVVEVAEMVLCGSVNKEISSRIANAGGKAVGLSGRDNQLLQCVKKIDKKGYDLGFVGSVEHVNTQFLNDLLDQGLCPVVSPIGTGFGDESDIAYNVNADVAAGRIAGELKAERVLFLTDIAGVLDKNKQLLPALSIQQVNNLIDDETITGGMIPKVQFATSAIQLGVKSAFITDGRVPHALLLEVLGGGATGLGSGQGGTVVTLE